MITHHRQLIEANHHLNALCRGILILHSEHQGQNISGPVRQNVIHLPGCKTWRGAHPRGFIARRLLA